jgi:hypothetical protein
MRHPIFQEPQLSPARLQTTYIEAKVSSTDPDFQEPQLSPVHLCDPRGDTWLRSPIGGRGPAAGGKKSSSWPQTCQDQSPEARGHTALSVASPFPRCAGDLPIGLAEDHLERAIPSFAARSPDAAFAETPPQPARRHAAVWPGSCASHKARRPLPLSNGCRRASGSKSPTCPSTCAKAP